jgi:adenine C2-methylase RlmN of 23S rRNA A2503 and tRNA A37
MIDKIKEQLEEHEYDYAVAIATQAEIDAGAACGQLSIIEDEAEE